MIDYDTSVKRTGTEVRKGLLNDEHIKQERTHFFKTNFRRQLNFNNLL